MRAVAGGEEGESELPYLLVTEEEVHSNIFIFFPNPGKGTGHFWSLSAIQVGSLEDSIVLEEGDTLELVTGHVTTGKASRLSKHLPKNYLARDVYGRNVEMVPGGFLENISFCIFYSPSSHMVSGRR